MKRWMPLTLLFLLASAAAARAVELPKPVIALTVGEEEKKKVLRALVTLNGKPLENATVTISVKRTFGNLPLGKDTTLDDGTAVVAFPTSLPGGPDGQLHIVADVSPTPNYSAAIAETIVPAGKVIAVPQDPFPRALWAPHAPLQLIIPIVLLLAGVWVTYAYVISQIIAIRKGATR
jgi:hypothetical protein